MDRKIGMRLSPSIGNEGIEAVAEWASGVGIDVIDVPYYNQEIKSVLEIAGLEVGSIDGIGAVGQTNLLSSDEKIRSEAVSALKNQITEVAELGGKVIFMCLVPDDLNMSRKDAFEIWRKSFPSIVEHAENHDVYIALEGWPGPSPQNPTLGCTPEMLRAMFKVIPSKHFGINYDPSHLVRLGIDYLRFLDEFKDRINYCHGKDTQVLQKELYESGVISSTFDSKYLFSEGSWRYTIPGKGDVDWAEVAVRLEKTGYQGPVSIELEDHYYWGSLEAERKGIMEAKEHLEAHFKNKAIVGE
ncbi:sugar phosphate isomerase/epimerase family protein [Jeotgalibacillus proteolyticus]|uniref:Sugar phosphate isomerase/epimerase n=1 Tax=Jeotgalibacillus proteolyticus TaxID=2082395 RepID=A0A2S5GBM8_9BACL|nr:sugar phosphate isomerase/epimerase [Jeotgalibacillus proteolyticus]PPA70447.1 sugar phosphate isomerase/epimerase [Jeotgalibacillus proteolyticus]